MFFNKMLVQYFNEMAYIYKMMAWPWHNVIDGISKTESIQTQDHAITRLIKNKTKENQNCIRLCSQSAKWSSSLALRSKYFLIQVGLVWIYPEILNLGLITDGLILVSWLTVAVATVSGTSWLTGMHFLSLIEGAWRRWILGTLGLFLLPLSKTELPALPCWDLL